MQTPPAVLHLLSFQVDFCICFLACVGPNAVQMLSRLPTPQPALHHSVLSSPYPEVQCVHVLAAISPSSC